MKNHKLVWKTKKQNIRYNVMDFSISLYQKNLKNSTKGGKIDI